MFRKKAKKRETETDKRETEKKRKEGRNGEKKGGKKEEMVEGRQEQRGDENQIVTIFQSRIFCWYRTEIHTYLNKNEEEKRIYLFLN